MVAAIMVVAWRTDQAPEQMRNCDAGWTGSDCSTPACPGACSGNGYCSTDLDPPRCICNGPTVLPTSEPTSPAQPATYGWTGPSCSTGDIPYCASTNCVANGGTCGADTTGYSCLINTCPPGFSGWDCSECTFTTLWCPVLMLASPDVCENTGLPECNGQGNCQLVGGVPTCVCRPGYSAGPNGDCQYGKPSSDSGFGG